MIDLIGYLALLLALFAMTMKKVLHLRLIHSLSCVFYAWFGWLSESMPVLLGAVLFGLIHVYHLKKIKKGDSHG